MYTYKNLILRTPCIPWRVRNAFEQWIETKCREHFPPLYRLFHCGRVRDIVRPVTQGPNHHFFGYYDKSPWNASGSLLLSHEVQFNDRPPTAYDPALVGVVRLSQGNRFEPLVKTYAWNWQQGSMLRWHPSDPEKLIMYNDRRDDHFVGIVRDVKGSEVRIYDRPFYAVTPDGRAALSLNFARLQKNRPGYGYAGVPDPSSEINHPEDDGIYIVNLETGKSRLIISLHQLAFSQPTEDMRGTCHWVNHIQVSRDGFRFAFLHRWRVGKEGWGTRLYTSNLDGSDLNCLLDGGMVSHYDWMDGHRLLAWTRLPATGDRFVLCDVRDGSKHVLGEDVLTEDGHCSFSPDCKWLLNDTYPDRHNMRTLMLYRIRDGKRFDLARFFSPKDKFWGEIRCDLHPRWSRDGKQVCVDSVHTGQRQMYTVDLRGIIK